jgi:hypothetical protein
MERTMTNAERYYPLEPKPCATCETRKKEVLDIFKMADEARSGLRTVSGALHHIHQMASKALGLNR